MNTEKWLPIVGYESLYEVSDLGRIRRTRSGRILKQIVRGRTGHVCVNLSNGAARLHFIHTLVLTAFVGPKPAGMECCHSPDHDPKNNALVNLRWDTHQRNMQDKTAHGNHPDRRGEKHPNAKMTEDVIEEARRLYAEGFTQAYIAQAVGVDQSAISRALSGKRWGHLRPKNSSG